MFGSLIVILPTVYEGGELILRRGGEEWTFDSADVVRTIQVGLPPASRPTSTPHAAFIAFFGGVEHEITPVSSGYRVTLTYNLYRKSSAVPPNPVYTEFEAQLMEGLAQLLKGPSFLPKGGILGFGLDHKYPINPTSTDLRGIEKCLKGMDESIRRVCESLSLKTTIGAIMGMMISKTGSQMALMLEQVDMMSSWTISLTLGADYRFEVTPK